MKYAADRRICLVTGASSGIGARLATLFAASGPAVVGIGYHTNKEGAEQTADHVSALGSLPVLVPGNLSDGVPQTAAALTTRFLDAVENAVGIRRIDVLVSNAGQASNEEIGHVSEETFNRLVNINMAAPLFLVQELLPFFPIGGRVIAVSSALTRVAAPQQLVYAATKAALNSLIVSLAQALGGREITVNAVMPGYIATDKVASRLALPGEREALAALSALGRIGTPDDVARVLHFLASDEARWITGQIIDVSGGSGLTGGLHRKRTTSTS